MRKKIIAICVVLLSFVFIGLAFGETLTFQWGMDDTTNLKEWKLFWSDTAGGPYDPTPVAVIPYNGGNGPFINTVTPPAVTGPQGTKVAKYFVLVSFGDIPQPDGTISYEHSANSNEVSYEFWIPAGMFSVPVQFQIISTP